MLEHQRDDSLLHLHQAQVFAYEVTAAGAEAPIIAVHTSKTLLMFGLNFAIMLDGASSCLKTSTSVPLCFCSLRCSKGSYR